MSEEKREQTDVISHWFTLVDNFQYSANDFYQAVEEELRDRRVPELKIERIEFHEGGAFSHKRVYLRLGRERLAFDVCAAPFGRAFFFSLRFIELPRGGWLRVILFLALLGILYEVGRRAFSVNPRNSMLVVVGAVIIGIAALVVKTVKEEKQGPLNRRDGLDDFDMFLLNLPLVGPLYDRRRKDTYYRQDTRLMYHTLITDIVKKKVEEVAALKGVKLVRTYERSPILGDLYKATTVKPEGGVAAVA